MQSASQPVNLPLQLGRALARRGNDLGRRSGQELLVGEAFLGLSECEPELGQVLVQPRLLALQIRAGALKASLEGSGHDHQGS
jgi:hypothetical protein